MAAKGLTRERLGAAALAIVDAEGLAALSMRRLAAELGVDPMAAYRHLDGKDDLMGLVMEQVLAEVDTNLPAGAWQHRLRTLARRILAVMTAHPNTGPLLGAQSWEAPAGRRIIEVGLATLDAAGLPGHHAVLAVTTTGIFLSALAPGTGTTRKPLKTEDVASRYPVTSRILAGGNAMRSYEEALDFWLDTVIASVEHALA